jgi:hypothetical protein
MILNIAEQMTLTIICCLNAVQRFAKYNLVGDQPWCRVWIKFGSNPFTNQTFWAFERYSERLTRLYLANLCTGYTYIRLSFNLYVQWFV